MVVQPTEEYGQANFAKGVGKILENMGFAASTDAAMNVLSALMQRYFEDLCKRTAMYKENAGRTKCILEDANRAFADQGIDLVELHDYVLQVGNLPVTKVPQYPVKKLKDANFGYYSNKPVVYIDPDNVPTIEALTSQPQENAEMMEVDEQQPSTSEAMDTSELENGVKKIVTKTKLYSAAVEKVINIPNFANFDFEGLGFSDKPKVEPRDFNDSDSSFNKSFDSSFTFAPVKVEPAPSAEPVPVVAPAPKPITPVLRPVGTNVPLKVTKGRNVGLAPFLPSQPSQAFQKIKTEHEQVAPSLTVIKNPVEESPEKSYKILLYTVLYFSQRNTKKREKETKKKKDKTKDKKHREKKNKDSPAPLLPMPGLDRFEPFVSAPVLAPTQPTSPLPQIAPITISIPPPQPVPTITDAVPTTKPFSNPPLLSLEQKDTPPPTLEPAEAVANELKSEAVEEIKKDKHHKKDKDKKEKKKKRDKEKKESKKRDHNGEVLTPVTGVTTTTPDAVTASGVSKPAGIKIKFKLGGQNSVESISPPKEVTPLVNDATVEPPAKSPKLEPVQPAPPEPLKVAPLRISPPKPFVPEAIAPATTSNDPVVPMEDVKKQENAEELPKSPKKHKKEKKHKRDKEKNGETEENGEENKEKHKKKSKDKEHKEKKEKKKSKDKGEKPEEEPSKKSPTLKIKFSNLGAEASKKEQKAEAEKTKPTAIPPTSTASQSAVPAPEPVSASPDNTIDSTISGETIITTVPIAIEVQPVPVVPEVVAAAPEVLPSQIVEEQKKEKKAKKEKKQKKDKSKEKEEKKDKEAKKEKRDKEKPKKEKKDKEKKEVKEKEKDTGNAEKEKEKKTKETEKSENVSRVSTPKLDRPNSSASAKSKIKSEKAEKEASRPHTPAVRPSSAIKDPIPTPTPPKTPVDKAPKPDATQKAKPGKPPKAPRKGKKDKSQKVWVCPKCSVAYVEGAADMVGCDSCDLWYHWHCVGMVRPPAADQDWFCPKCTKERKGGKLKNKSKK
ncbi:unnamed protein product [Bursaphelenchus okinawaensis]|uniref:PHD-type domain-containing protein n=1 Tax=Bursaphelenchus okinawaensis TaxID=465554 RepID=A0A811KE85_9BILA|nr:unnamed protein product [Bursaphelenchus okinawaensis]CAG9103059.1 unnamed protein product [Bursaphelenchus okinawaensis]